jgi:uncharacterized protein (DUF1501 family)
MKRFSPKMDAMTRRQLLTGGAAAASATALSTLLDFRLTKAALAASGNTDGYKALVCLFFNGGIDSHNMMAPYDQAEYNDYVTVRGAPGTPGGLALPKETGGANDLLPISDSTGRQFGIHPGMPEIRDLYNSGDLAFLSNIGSLIVPTDKSSYNNRLDIPLGIYSHSDMQRHWQTTVPQSRSQLTGWAGRMGDCLTDPANSTPSIGLNIAINNLNVMQTGDDIVPYVVHETGAAQLLSGYQGTNARNRILTRVSDSLYLQTYSDLLQQTHANVSSDAIDAAITFNAAVNDVQVSTPFPNTQMGRRLNMVARTIAARSTLAQSRQMFFVSRGGWDHHRNLIGGQAVMMPEVSQAINAFKLALEELGVYDDVTTFGISDFARTCTSNGQGSDHGWGGNTLAFGGSVKGGQVYGHYPHSLLNATGPDGGDINTGRGRYIPTMSVDEYYAELAMWFGVSDGPDLETILPNLRNFVSAGSGSHPIGFMS